MRMHGNACKIRNPCPQKGQTIQPLTGVCLGNLSKKANPMQIINLHPVGHPHVELHVLLKPLVHVPARVDHDLSDLSHVSRHVRRLSLHVKCHLGGNSSIDSILNLYVPRLVSQEQLELET